MNDILMKLVHFEEVSDEDIASALCDICERVHASCDSECPVYAKNDGPVNPHKPFEENRGCDCYRNGMAMLEFLRKGACKG